jgi:hypothetical protein
MHNLDTINRGNHIKTYDYPEDYYYNDYYEPINIDEDEIEYED